MCEQSESMTRRIFMAVSGAAAVGAGMSSIASMAEGAQNLPKMSEQDRRNVEVVYGWHNAFKTGDANKIGEYVHENFRNNGDVAASSGDRVGKESYIKSIAEFLKSTRVEMHILDAFALHPMVVTCHHQLFESKEHGFHEDLYIGCFYMEDGKIREWRDFAIIPYDNGKHERVQGTAARGRFIHLGGEVAKAHA